ncbi:DNA glycosylase [Pluteus cervinus]|uniref:DNA glycosylase n=1 Tax=Pluteus cervinus TaxID=181527 RepID=A0ACD3BGF6_9AGAR|nr:DNA glycosylase [Pluteus cervinus]
MNSPYFSPDNTSPKASHPIITNSATSLNQRSNLIDETDEAELSQNPLFCYCFRAFAVLYRQLLAVKPRLIQEIVADDPWKLLIAVTLLNKTCGTLAIPAFWNILSHWPTPWHLASADVEELSSHIQHLGLQNVRARRLTQLSEIYMQDPPSVYDRRTSRVSASSNGKYPATPISHLPGAGRYALDSYRIFCTAHQDPGSEEWKSVLPTDKELICYLVSYNRNNTLKSGPLT